MVALSSIIGCNSGVYYVVASSSLIGFGKGVDSVTVSSPVIGSLLKDIYILHFNIIELSNPCVNL